MPLPPEKLRHLLRERRRAKLATVIPNEILAEELARFLDPYYPMRPGTALLDVGAGSKPYAQLYESCFERCLSNDVEHSPHDISGVDTIASADSLPFADAEFDAVICTEVLEHCPDPSAVVKEIARVLKPDGKTFITTPFLVALHEMPYDFYRYTPSALSLLSERAGLEVIEIEPRGDYIAVALSIFLLPVTKLWQQMAKVLGGAFYSASNPGVYVTVVLPQLVYLGLWRAARLHPTGPLARVYRRLTYYTTGYVLTARRPS